MMNLCAAALAAPPPEPQPLALRQMHHTAWRAHEGAPGDIRSIAQTPDGFLWLGADTGLYRFDGVRFERVETLGGQRLHAASVSALLATRDGGLVIGYLAGGVSTYRAGTLTTYAAQSEVPRGTVSHLLQAANGDIWGTFGNGAARLRGATWQTFANVQGTMFSSGLLQDKHGAILLTDSNGVLRLDPEQPAFAQLHADTGRFANLAMSHDGSLWLGDRRGEHLVAVRLEGDRLVQDSSRSPVPMPEKGAIQVLFSSDRALWIASAMGVVRCLGQQSAPRTCQTLGAKDGLSSDSSLVIFEDREGSIWVGTAGGLDRFRRPSVVNVDPGDAAAISIAPKAGGDLWLNSYRAGLRGLSDPQRQTLPPAGVATLHRDPGGTLWVGSEYAVWRFPSAGEPERIPLPAELKPPSLVRIQAMAVDGKGDLWISVFNKDAAGQYRRHAGEWTYRPPIAGLPTETAFSMAADGRGGVWFGFSRSRASRVADGTVTASLSEREGLKIGTVLAIRPVEEGVWFGGEFGLAHFDGKRLRHVRLAGDEPLRGVSGIVRTAEGRLWLATATGVYRIEENQWRAVLSDAEMDAEMGFTRLDHQDGLRGVPHQLAPLPSLVEGDDGRIWVATGAGVAYIDPSQPVRNTVVPGVHLRGVRSTQGYYLADQPVNLQRGERDFQVEYAATSLAMPERVRFRYRLDGYDKDWRDAGNQRIAAYTGVPPGRYTLRVTAANNDGVWNQEGASLAIEVPPAIWQTTWFRALLALAVCLALAGAYRWRVGLREARIRDRMEGRLAERLRIAQDLHDTFLQSLVALTLQVQKAVDEIEAGSPLRSRMERALVRTDEVMAEGREQIQMLRQLASPGSSLGELLAAAAGTLSDVAEGTPCRVEVHGDVRTLQPEVAEDLFRAAFEAISNALRHSGAEEVKVDVRYDRDALHVSVRDDGRGFSASQAEGRREGHFGLQTMRERLSRAGGECAVQSGPSGTEVRLRVPARRAYADAARWWARWARPGPVGT